MRFFKRPPATQLPAGQVLAAQKPVSAATDDGERPSAVVDGAVPRVRPVDACALTRTPPALYLAPAGDDDFEALLSLRLAAMHESLQRLGRFDPERARERLSRGFEPAHTRHILAHGQRVGFVVLLPEADHLVLDHLYITPEAQGRGIGAWVMAQVLAQADAAGLPVQVTALKLSAANRFYLRHGFVLQHESDWDMHYLRPAQPQDLVVPGPVAAPTAQRTEPS